MRNLTELFGSAWATKNILPKLLSFQKEKSYLQRLTPLFAFQKLAPIMTPDALHKYVAPGVIGMAGDRISNVRMNVARTLQEFAPYLKGKDSAVSNVSKKISFRKRLSRR